MKVLLLVLFFQYNGIQAACLPESELESFAVTKNNLMAEEVVQKFQSIILKELPEEYDMVVNLEPMNPRVNAEIIKKDQVLSISVWGGMLSHPLLTEGTFSLLLCHEIGHFLGGPPLKSRNGWSSTEGQADYFSTATCASAFGMRDHEFLEAALSLTKIYADVSREPAPSLTRCDETVVSRTNFGYPKAQCRLDTLIAGWNGLKRPACWFLE
jgi:hypothetical protein